MTKIIVTLGPATNNLEKLNLIKSKAVDFVRINMSHSTIDDLKYYIDLSKKVNIPFIIDTEGSQVRTGNLIKDSITFKENDFIYLHKDEIIGDSNKVNLRPKEIIDQLDVGDILYVDFDTLVMRVLDLSTHDKGYIKAVVISSGNLGKNKGVVIDPQLKKQFTLPTLTSKDIKAAKLGLEENIGYIAASFMRNASAVRYVREITKGKMKIISKIECEEALLNLDEIIDESDFLLIDRGDLSKEIPIEKIPFTQKIILNRAKRFNKGVYVATNLLESMISNRKPTRAEVHDIINTIVDGAYGLTLAAETAIGKYPIGCINMLNKIIKHSDLIINAEEIRDKETEFVKKLESKNYLLDQSSSSSLISPHGGKLVDRVLPKGLENLNLKNHKKISLNENQLLDFEQIAIGTYSPLDGFMNQLELESVLNNLTLPNGVIWSIPILLDVDFQTSKNISIGEKILLTNSQNEPVGFIDVSEIFSYDKLALAKKMYDSLDENHPGVKIIKSLNPVFIAGKITLTKIKKTDYRNLELTPKQARRIFEEKNWEKVVGFHTRNVIHKAHEYIQLSALKKGNCDGIFLHPVVGKKKKGDYNSKYIIKSYEIMQDKFYPENKTLLGVFSTYSRYAGFREAIFTSLCRQNFGCSHFIIGRDHAGSGLSKTSSIDLKSLELLEKLDIEILNFNDVFYSKEKNIYMEEDVLQKNSRQNKFSISGTKARELLKSFKKPPTWFMRKEISQMIINSIKSNEEVFVDEN